MLKEKLKLRGGIHPTNGYDKTLTLGKEIISYIPEVVRINMKQGLGPACLCVVNVNEHVEQGQLIAEAKHFMSAPIHASVSGIVLSVTEDFCEIKVDDCQLFDNKILYNQQWADLSLYSKEGIIESLKQGGLVGMGGAGFPTGVKYDTKDPIEYVLINGAECEPFLTCDEHIMLEQGMAVLNGIQVLKKAANAKAAILVMEDNKKHVKEHLDPLLKDQQDISIMLVPTLYPQGGERQLVVSALGKEIPAGQLPSSIGVIISNVETAKAAADMVLNNVPCISRCITITGDVKNPGNYLVPIGTPISELIKDANGMTSSNNRIILGGPMTGTCIAKNASEDDILETVTKVSGGLVVLASADFDESDCIRCGGCENVCPAGLNPFKIDFAYRMGNIQLCQDLHATECIGCGCCSYTCPAKRELSHHVVKARDAVRAKLREEANHGNV